jgi:hypothetical protein
VNPCVFYKMEAVDVSSDLTPDASGDLPLLIPPELSACIGDTIGKLREYLPELERLTADAAEKSVAFSNAKKDNLVAEDRNAADQLVKDTGTASKVANQALVDHARRCDEMALEPCLRPEVAMETAGVMKRHVLNYAKTKHLSRAVLFSMVEFFCPATLPRVTEELNRWAMKAPIRTITVYDTTYTLICVASSHNKDRSELPSTHDQCMNPYAMIVFTSENPDQGGKFDVNHVIPQNTERLAYLTTKVAALHAKLKRATLAPKGNKKNSTVFSPDDEADLKACEDEINEINKYQHSLEVKTPAKLQDKLSKLYPDDFATNDQHAFFAYTHGALIVAATKERMSLKQGNVAGENVHDMYAVVMAHKAATIDATKELLDRINAIRTNHLVPPPSLLKEYSWLKTRPVPSSLIIECLPRALSPNVTKELTKALGIFSSNAEVLAIFSEKEKLEELSLVKKVAIIADWLYLAEAKKP